MGSYTVDIRMSTETVSTLQADHLALWVFRAVLMDNTEGAYPVLWMINKSLSAEMTVAWTDGDQQPARFFAAPNGGVTQMAPGNSILLAWGASIDPGSLVLTAPSSYPSFQVDVTSEQTVVAFDAQKGWHASGVNATVIKPGTELAPILIS